MTRPNKRSAAQVTRLAEHARRPARSASDLRRRAEDVFLENAAQAPGSLEALSPEATRQMLHELGVHQIELEMQNEELRLAQVALDSALEHYVDLYDHAPMGYFSVSEAGLILQANLHTAALFGLARSALVSRRISSLICKEDQDIYYLCRKKTIEADDRQSCEVRMTKHDGTPFWASLAISMAQDSEGAPAHRVVLNDITERKRMELTLAESEERFGLFMDNLPVAAFIKDENSVTLYANRFMEDILGVRNWRGKSARDLFPAELAERMIADDRASLDAGHMVIEEQILGADGKQRIFQTHKVRIPRREQPPLLGGFALDITERKHVEQQLAEMSANLEEIVKDRTRRLRAVSAQLTMSEENERRLLAQELHDNLGQLLAVIKIKLTSLDANSFKSSVRQILELVGQADRSARTITRQLRPPILDTLGFVPALSWLAREMERTHDLSVRFDSETEPNPLAEGVQALLYRSVRELLINVAKHAKTNEASLSIRCDAHRLMLVVSDNGCGFSPAFLSDAPLQQGGFGLSSVSERVTNIGGEMHIESQPGKGTMVTLSMPYSAVPTETLAP